MILSDFTVGLVFYVTLRAPQPYIVTDIGKRVVVAALFIEDGVDHTEYIEFVISADELEYCTLKQPKEEVREEEEFDALDELGL